MAVNTVITATQIKHKTLKEIMQIKLGLVTSKENMYVRDKKTKGPYNNTNEGPYGT